MTHEPRRPWTESERDAALADAQRFVWWFDDGYNKGPFVVEYLRGIRERWSLDQWRAAIDKAMGGVTQT